ncbi:hypothetical protein M885DRAFT_572314 [Pelagophyceae sp. CCMP2097]|nr:hypothetical protein M885DRAFT_572314 [Pelagophyceae sp. CCMP2097]
MQYLCVPYAASWLKVSNLCPDCRALGHYTDVEQTSRLMIHFQRAADDGYALALYDLGVLHYEGVPQSDNLAARCWMDATIMFNAEAMFRLGLGATTIAQRTIVGIKVGITVGTSLVTVPGEAGSRDDGARKKATARDLRDVSTLPLSFGDDDVDSLRQQRTSLQYVERPFRHHCGSDEDDDDDDGSALPGRSLQTP